MIERVGAEAIQKKGTQSTESGSEDYKRHGDKEGGGTAPLQRAEAEDV